ncbi:hypothetical protein DPEC_G00307600 [Dallia pectoralis]|uniref:Uncharacterized protein n=1 Tax=Dallia pectoralis TaxID=75939 RepID=A0ACC2FED8_DALPE|nr:hypothetical protein DPEC_G00307600 [Dallia pectoralis]
MPSGSRVLVWVLGSQGCAVGTHGMMYSRRHIITSQGKVERSGPSASAKVISRCISSQILIDISGHEAAFAPENTRVRLCARFQLSTPQRGFPSMKGVPKSQ